MTMQTSSGSTSDGRSTGVAAASSASYSSPSRAVGGHLDDLARRSVSLSRILSIVGISSAPTISTLAPESLTA